MAEKMTCGSAYLWQLAALRVDEDTGEEAAWDLTGATVTLYLTSPSGVETSYSATVTGAAAGIASYQGDGTELGEPNLPLAQWRAAWRVRQGAADVTGDPVPLRVVRARR